MKTRTRNLKRLLSLALCLCMVTGLLPVTALAANAAPAITTATLAEATVGEAYTAQLTATASDQNGTLTWEAEGLPQWLTLTDNGDGTLAVTLANNGNVHQILYDCQLTIKDAEGGSVTLSGSDALPGISGSNILAGMTWTKDIPFPDGLAAGSTYSASIEYDFDIENQ